MGLSRTDGSGLDHVADGEALDGLVLGGAAGAVGAAHRLDVAAAILVATAIKSISYRAPDVANRSNPVSHSSCPAMCQGRDCRCLWMYVSCALPSASLRRYRMGFCFVDMGGLLVLLVRPLLDHFDGLFCGGSDIGLWVKWGGR